MDAGWVVFQLSEQLRDVQNSQGCCAMAGPPHRQSGPMVTQPSSPAVLLTVIADPPQALQSNSAYGTQNTPGWQLPPRDSGLAAN